MVETSPATGISFGYATLNGRIISNGGKVDEYGFKYWFLGSDVPVIVDKADHTGDFSKTIIDLKPGTYSYKAYATNAEGSVAGQVYSFTVINPAIKVFLDSGAMSFEVPPFIEQDRIMVPFRAIFEAHGAVVQWDAETRTVTAAREDLEIKLVIDGPAYKDGEIMSLEIPAKIVNSRTFVPLRFVTEALGGNVRWDDINKVVFITR